jgi:cardiolipin synthase
MLPGFDRPWRHVPNLITLVRGLLVPVIGWLLAEERYDEAFWTVAASAASDLVDGGFARRFDAQSRFGAIADPVADKLTMLAVVAGLTWQGLLPAWVAVAIVARDVIIVAGAIAYHRRVEPVAMTPTRLSKLNTVVEFVVLAAVLADAAGYIDATRWLPVGFALVLLTVAASGLQYVWVWGRRACLQRQAQRADAR